MQRLTVGEEPMFSYTAYGLGIRSTIPLPELMPTESASDVVIRPGTVIPPAIPPTATETDFALWAAPGEVHLLFKKVGTFLIRRGQEIVADPDPDVEEQVVRLFVLGLALALLLHQRGFLVLHANTVAVNGAAIAFLGEPGQGKSTTSAAFYKQGYSIVSDDVTAIHVDTECPLVYPGVPRLKLCRDTAAFFGGGTEALPHLRPWKEKYARHVAREFPQRPLPLRRIYILTYGERIEFEPLQLQKSLIALVRHSYSIAAHTLRATGEFAAHFRQCERLARCVPIRLLKRPRDLSALPDLVRLVEEDVARTP